MMDNVIWTLVHQAFGESRNDILRRLYAEVQPDIFLRGTLHEWHEIAPDIPNKIWHQLLDLQKNFDAEKRAAWMLAENILLLPYNDPGYPEKLRTIYDPPAFLYVKGHLRANALHIGMVGSRKSTVYGREAAEYLSYGLSTEDCVVVSGLARGIDAASHRGALGGGGGTIGVLGTSIEKCYPRENKSLYTSILDHPNGAIISAFPFNSPPLRHHFPRRNRIIAGLVDGLVVVEAAEVSGALITAGLAADNGRDIFAVPGSIFAETCKGTLRLLKDGAKMVADVNDILEEYGQLALFKEKEDIDQHFTDDEIAILDLLTDTPMVIDELAIRLEKDISVVVATLSILEINGYVASLPGRQYVKRFGK